MGLKLFQIDAFTKEPFAGNPAAVCLLEEERDSAWMQNLAAEMNLSETAFVRPLGGDRWSLRWFTPTVEVPLCGHATLATAHALMGELGHKGPLRFETKSGELRCEATDDGRISLDFPAVSVKSMIIPEQMERALGGVRPITASKGHGSEPVIISEVADVEELLSIRPFYQLIADSPWGELFIVTCEGKGDYDFHSRVFAPKCGIPEDPVTGSAHCALATYWAKRLGKNDLYARQESKRGGDLWLTLKGDRVIILGHAVTVFEGELR